MDPHRPCPPATGQDTRRRRVRLVIGCRRADLHGSTRGRRVFVDKMTKKGKKSLEQMGLVAEGRALSKCRRWIPGNRLASCSNRILQKGIEA